MMLKFIDKVLDKITMYRLVLYYLILLLVAAVVLSMVGVLHYSAINLLFVTAFLLAVCWITNTIFAKVYKAATNVESVYITALILTLIITPTKSIHDLFFLGWAAVWAMASKYIFAIKAKHLFNPVAFAVALLAITLNQSATWWIGNLPMLPVVLLGGLLIVRKIRRFDLVISFLLSATLVSLVLGIFKGSDLGIVLKEEIIYSPLLFFAFVMITEPLTTPPTKRLRVGYGALTGFLFSPLVHLGPLYFTPELALLVGNIFSYLVSPKIKLILKLKEKIKLGSDIYDFIFTPKYPINFVPGQYMEWTLSHESPDSRGVRRYFTIASSPTEKDLRMGVKFYQKSSSFKKSMLQMNQNTEIVASQLAGDFTLPKDPMQKCVFIAGGIGITPFRSMIQYLLDTKESRPIILFYANRTASEIVYRDVFDRAEKELRIKTIYTLTDQEQIPNNWQGKRGYIDERMIKEEVPNFLERTFYLSGPHSMVSSFEEVLLKLGVNKKQIKVDFFPGFA